MRFKKAVKREFLKHLFFEFSHNIFSDDGLHIINENKDLIYEERGLFPHLDEIIETIYNVFKPLISNVKENETKYIEKQFVDLENLFIHNLKIKIHYTNAPNQERGSNGFFICNNNIYKIDNESKLDNAIIEYIIKCKKASFDLELKSMLAHELLHAYEEYQRNLKGEDSLFDALTKCGYFRNKDWANQDCDKIRLMIRQIRYFLAQVEQNAYLVQIREELKKYGNEMSSAKDAYRILSEKTMFKMYIHVGEYINFFYNTTNGEVQEIALDEWNRLSNIHIIKFYNLRRILKNKYLRRLRDLERKLSIIAEEIFSEYGNKRMINFSKF